MARPKFAVWDPVTLQEKRRFTVRDRGQPVLNLNELEYVHGEFLPTSGKPIAWCEFHPPMDACWAGSIWPVF